MHVYMLGLLGVNRHLSHNNAEITQVMAVYSTGKQPSHHELQLYNILYN